MIRGKQVFRCIDCHMIFIGIDAEWQATVYSAPIACPQCGGFHTLPLLAPKHLYKHIWETMDKNQIQSL